MQLSFVQQTPNGDSTITETMEAHESKRLFGLVVSRIFCDPDKAAAFLRETAEFLEGKGRVDEAPTKKVRSK